MNNTTSRQAKRRAWLAARTPEQLLRCEQQRRERANRRGIGGAAGGRDLTRLYLLESAE